MSSGMLQHQCRGFAALAVSLDFLVLFFDMLGGPGLIVSPCLHRAPNLIIEGFWWDLGPRPKA